MEVEDLPVILLRRQGKDAMQGVVLVEDKSNKILSSEVRDTISTLK